MKRTTGLFILIALVASVNTSGQLTVPELTIENEKEVLYNHVIAYATCGIEFAKTKGVSPLEYGQFIGEKFIPFWNPEDGFHAFAGQIMFILSGMHPDNQMQIEKQEKNMICFRMKNVDLMFRQGPAFGVTYPEFLACSEGIISTLADYMKVDFSHRVVEDTWYEVTLKAK